MDHDNLEGDIRSLLALLKKILKTHPQGSDQIAKFLEDKAVDLNLCFLTIFPIIPEDMAEFEAMYREMTGQSGDSPPGAKDLKIEFKLNPEDKDFLKKNGIRF